MTSDYESLMDGKNLKVSLYRSDIVLLRNLSFGGWRHTY